MDKVITLLDKIYKKNGNYYTIQKIHDEYIIGITPFNGHMVHGKGKTLEEALINFLDKHRGVPC